MIGRIHDAGGVTSIAHPGLLRHDDWLPGLVEAGLDAIEAYHTDHDPAATARYVSLAGTLNVAVSGGSDYHADLSHGGVTLGCISLPRGDYDRLTRIAHSRD